MLAIGLAMLLTAAHVIIPGTISIAHYLRIPAHVVAVLLIAAGTSAPELVVAVQAGLNGTPEIVWGNIIGSNITNILVVLSITGLLFTINTNDLAIKRDMLLLIAITALICLPAYYFYSLPLFVGFLLVIILASYTFFLVNQKPSEQETEKNLKLLADSWRMAQEIDKAIPILEKVSKISKDGKSYVLLGNLYLSEDKISKAIESIEKGIKKGGLKNISQVHMALGQAYFENQNFDTAKKQFRIAARSKDVKIKKSANNWIKYTENEEVRVKNLALRRDFIQNS